MEDKKYDFEALQKVDIRTVDPDMLVDINNIMIDSSLSKEERIAEFLKQIKNPYCFKCGNIVVKTSFKDTVETLEGKLEGYLNKL